MKIASADTAHAGPWRTLEIFTLHRHAQLRFRIAVQQHEDPVHGLAHDEARRAAGVFVEDEDARAFAQGFLATMAQHLSAADLDALQAALQTVLQADPAVAAR